MENKDNEPFSILFNESKSGLKFFDIISSNVMNNNSDNLYNNTRDSENNSGPIFNESRTTNTNTLQEEKERNEGSINSNNTKQVNKIKKREWINEHLNMGVFFSESLFPPYVYQNRKKIFEDNMNEINSSSILRKEWEEFRKIQKEL